MSSVWRYIELNDFVRPPEPSTEIARKGLRSLLNRLRRTSNKERPVSLSAELRTVPHGLLDSLAPVPVLTDAEEALSSALEPWLEGKIPESHVRVIVGSPGSGPNGNYGKQLNQLMSTH